MSTTIDIAKIAHEQLTGFNGHLTGPHDAGYDEARRVYNSMIDKRPVLIARCTTPDDVAQMVRFARDNELPLAVRGGGHNGAGLGTVDDGVVIDLAPLRDITVDPQARTVRVGGGCTWGRRPDHERSRAGHAERDHLDHRCRRAHAGWRTRTPDPQVRAEHRQSARGRDGPGQR